MVLDNADNLDVFFAKPKPSGMDVEPTRPLIDYLPESSQGSILVTTRDNRIGKRLGSKGIPIVVGYMNLQEGQELLRSQLDQTDDLNTNDSRALIDTLEYIPLAITQAAAFIEQNNITLTKYLEMLNMDDSDLQDLLQEDSGDLRRDSESQNSVFRTWKLSFDLIGRQKPRAAEILSLMSVLDRQGIPRSLLQTDVDGNVDTTTALGTLQAFSLISRQAGAEEYEMHRLIQLATQKWLQIQGTKDEWQERALGKLADIFPNSEFESWITCDLLLPHAQKVLANDYRNEKDIIRKAYLSRQLGIFDDTQGRYEAASTRLSVALDLERNTLGVEHPDTLGSMANLASTYRNQGRWDEAEKLEVQVMKTSLRVLKEEHPSTLTSMANLALTYWNQGRWDEAEKLQMQVMKTRKKVLKEEHPDTLSSMVNLAATYWNQGRWDKAEKLEVQVMETRKRLLKEEHPDTLTSMANLAVTYWNQGRWDEAEKLQMQVMKTRKRVLKEEHPHTLISMANLATVYWKQGRWDEAIELIQVVVNLRTKIIGVNHPDTLDAVDLLDEWRS